MRKLISLLVFALSIAIPAVGMVAIMAGGEVQRMYHNNGHSLNPMKYMAALPKIRLNHPFWFGKWSHRQV